MFRKDFEKALKATIEKAADDALALLNQGESEILSMSSGDINKLLGTSYKSDDEFCLFTILASDNLVNRSYRKWHQTLLRDICEQSIGVPFLLNHDWDDAEEIIGIVVNTELKTYSEIPEGYKQVRGYEEVNKKIVDKEGLQVAYFTVAVPKECEAKGKIEQGIYKGVSTGGFLESYELICPNCSAEKGREVSFLEVDKMGDYVCPHQMPYSFMNPQFNEDENYNFADYMEINGVYDAIELSVVVSPNLPNAKVVREIY